MVMEAGDSSEQRRAELLMVESLGQRLGTKFRKERLYFARPTPAWAEVDAVSFDPPVLVEAWAHQGPPKSARKTKVMADVAKMAWLAATHLPGARKILLLSDDAAAAHFRGTSWMAAALAHFGVEIIVVALPTDVRAGLLAAQERQYR
jgi:hypothetical protein